MTIVTLSVASREDVTRRALAAFEGKQQGSHISFASFDLLWKVLAPKRLELIRALTGAGPVAIREAARRVNRDVKAVHNDIHALLAAGVFDRTEDGKVVFPYDTVHVDFTFSSIAA